MTASELVTALRNATTDQEVLKLLSLIEVDNIPVPAKLRVLFSRGGIDIRDNREEVVEVCKQKGYRSSNAITKAFIKKLFNQLNGIDPLIPEFEMYFQFFVKRSDSSYYLKRGKELVIFDEVERQIKQEQGEIAYLIAHGLTAIEGRAVIPFGFREPVEKALDDCSSNT